MSHFALLKQLENRVSFFAGRVSGLTNRETKKKKIEDCTKECAKMVVTMLRPVPDDELCES